MPTMCQIWVVTQLNLKNVKKILPCFTGTAHHSRDAATGFAAVATQSRTGCWSMEGRRWPYQPKHSPSFLHVRSQANHLITDPLIYYQSGFFALMPDCFKILTAFLLSVFTAEMASLFQILLYRSVARNVFHLYLNT